VAQTAETSLEARIRDLEAFARSISAGNVTDRASVVNATGEYVPLSDLAFGQVGAENPTVGAISLNSVPNQGNPTSLDPSNWSYIEPTIDVFVRGGRMRVDFAAVLAANGNTTALPEIAMSYRAMFRGATNDGSVNTLAIAPSRYRCIKLVNLAGSASVLSYGSFGFHSGLAAGWYRVQPAFILVYASAPASVQASADYPRVAVTPL
jgi:hypothetical protein